MKNENKSLKLILLSSLAILTVIGCFWAFLLKNSTLNFIHISDTHIANKDKTTYSDIASSKILLEDAIEQINDIKGINFVLFSGDLINRAKENNFKNFYALCDNLKYPFLNAFGNHDFYHMDKKEVLNLTKKYNHNYSFDDTFYAYTPKKGYRIIVLDSIIKRNDTANGYLDTEQLKFLDNELSANKDNIVLIALHHPLIAPYENKNHALLNAAETNKIISKYKNPIIVLSGHYHSAKITKIDNVIHVSTPAMVTYPMAFRHVKLTNLVGGGLDVNLILFPQD